VLSSCSISGRSRADYLSASIAAPDAPLLAEVIMHLQLERLQFMYKLMQVEEFTLIQLLILHQLVHKLQSFQLQMHDHFRKQRSIRCSD
jgi:hypothetical protein